MNNTVNFDMQLFAEEENQIEVPVELEGISPETVADILKEADIASEPDEVPDVGIQDEKENVKESNENPLETDSLNNEEEKQDSKKPSHIPYDRFKQVNDEKKAKDEENARLRAELDSIRQQQQAQIQEVKPEAQSILQNLPPEFTQQELNKFVADMARTNALKLAGIKDGDIENLEYEDTEKKQYFETAYQIELAKAARVIDEAIQIRNRENQLKENVQGQANKEYEQLVSHFQNQEDFANVFNYASNEYFTSLDPLEQRALQESFDRTEKKTASLQDVLIVRNHFKIAQEKYRAAHQPPAEAPAEALVETQTKTKPNKFEQMKAHPRSEQISGASNPGEMTTADLERMIKSTPWDKIPPECQKILLGE